MKKYPSYLNLSENQFHERIKKAYNYLQSCSLCPHQCEVNRALGQKGLCSSTEQVLISSYNAHFGEEPPISGLLVRHLVLPYNLLGTKKVLKRIAKIYQAGKKPSEYCYVGGQQPSMGWLK